MRTSLRNNAIVLIVLLGLCPVLSASWYDAMPRIAFPGFGAPDAPSHMYPPDGSRFGPGSDVLMIEFSTVPDAVSYEIEFSFSEIFSEEFIFSVPGNSFDFGEFLSQEDWDGLSFQFYWRVRGVISMDETTEWSIPWEFSKSRLGPPDLLTPGRDARFNQSDAMPYLRWSAPDDESVQYALEVGEDEDFSVSFGWFILPANELDFNAAGSRDTWDAMVGTFYWRVWYIESSGAPSPPSDTFYFSKTTIAKPALRFPQDETHFPAYSSIPVLEWETVTGSTGYHVQLVGGESEFPWGLNYIEIQNNRMDFSDYGVTQSIWDQVFGTIRWRVSGVDEMGNHGSFARDFKFVKIAANRYMAYGDSVTGGFGSSSWGSGFAGYPPMLQNRLRGKYGSHIQVVCQEQYSWFGGGHAYTGDWQAQRAMGYHGPSVVLIMFGIVDAIDTGAPGCENHDCHVRDHLQNIIYQVRSYQAEPLLATLPPVNPASDRFYVQTNVDGINADIRDLAMSANVPLADLEAAFFNAPMDLPDYFANGDWAHFNDMGYELIADTWYQLL